MIGERHLRVCFLTTGYPRFEGDLFGAFVHELAAVLVEAGHSVEVVAPHEAGLPRFERHGNLTVRRFRYMLPTGLQRLAYGGGIPTNLQRSWVARMQIPMFLLAFVWSALGACRRADVVHAHWTVCGLVGRLATILWRRPLVLSVRGSDAKLAGGGVVAKVNRWVWRSVGVNIAVSEDIAQALRTSGVPDRQVKVVPNGVSGRFRPLDPAGARTQLGLPPTSFIILYAGLLVPIKGLDILVAALAELEAPDWRCVLVGDGPLADSLVELGRAAGLGDRLHLAGRRPSDEMPIWLSAADVLVLPSHSEGRPNVVLEAQACATPVVATRVGGTPELVEDGRTGLLVNPGDAAALKNAIDRLAGSAGSRREMGLRGRAFIESSALTWEASGAAVDAIYRELVGQRESR